MSKYGKALAALEAGVQVSYDTYREQYRPFLPHHSKLNGLWRNSVEDAYEAAADALNLTPIPVFTEEEVRATAEAIRFPDDGGDRAETYRTGYEAGYNNALNDLIAKLTGDTSGKSETTDTPRLHQQKGVAK